MVRSEGMKPSSSIGKRSSSLLRSSSPTSTFVFQGEGLADQGLRLGDGRAAHDRLDERNAVPVHGQLAETQPDEDPGQERVAGHVATDGDRRARRPRHVDQ